MLSCHDMPLRPDSEDPIFPFFRKWISARTEWRHLVALSEDEEGDTPECDAAFERENAAFQALLNATPSSLSGIAVLTRILWDQECDFIKTDPDDTICKLIASIWRAASGENCLPPRV